MPTAQRDLLLHLSHQESLPEELIKGCLRIRIKSMSENVIHQLTQPQILSLSLICFDYCFCTGPTQKLLKIPAHSRRAISRHSPVFNNNCTDNPDESAFAVLSTTTTLKSRGASLGAEPFRRHRRCAARTPSCASSALQRSLPGGTRVDRQVHTSKLMTLVDTKWGKHGPRNLLVLLH